MNKIFKVVWNRTIGSFVVTSELAKGRVKSSSEGAEGDVRASEEGRLKTLFRLTALSAALFGLSESAWAHPIINSEGGKVATGGASETAVGGGSARGVGSVAVGAFAKAGTRIEADGAIAIGGSQASTGAFADGNNSIAIGQASNANANKATSIGSDTIASHEWTSAIGARAEAKNLGATSLGSWTQATGEYSIAIGGSDAQGRAANAGTLASGSRSTAIGRNAKSAGADAIALGTSTKASGVEAVAIGQGAASTAAKALAFGQGAQAKESDTVAVGTGAQATLANSIAIGKDSVATGTYGTGTAGRAIAIGFNTKALGEDSVAIGSGVDGNAAALAQNRQSVALGWKARATGTTQAVAIGPEAYASGAQSTSIGNNTRATGDSSIAIGGDDWDDAKKSVNAQYKALTGSDMSDGYQGTTSATAAVAVGVKAQAKGALSTAFGPGTTASGLGASAFGVGASATQDKSVAIGAGSHTNTDATAVTTATVNGITYGGFAGTTHITSGSQVSFGSAGYERQLKHVAPGAITATSTDAINGSQLYALHAGSGNIAKAVADALGGGAAVGIDPTNNQGTVTLPSYDVLKGSDKPNTAGNGTAKFNTTPAKNVAAAMTNLNTYVNQGFTVKDNVGDAKGIVTPGESVQFADGNATTVTVDTEANGNTKIKYDVKVDDSTIKVVDGKLTGASQTHFYSVNSADQTKANYNNDGATGENAIAAGPEAKAAASNAVVMGNKATVEAAAGSDSTINGETTGEGSVAVGALSKASGKNATAIGQKANAYGQNSFAGGQDTESSGKSSVAIGDGSRATDNSTTAVGPYAKAQKAGASAFGFNANAQAIGSVAVGRLAQALNLNAVSVGNESKAKGEDTVAIGNGADAVQNRAMAIGKGAVANGADTIAFGAATKADQRYAIAIGSGNNAWKTDSIALGRAANADGAASLALGLSSHTREANAIALGNNANADDTNSIAIGTNSKAAQAAAVAIGNNATALKSSAVVIGEEAKSNNSRSVVIGYYASAINPAMSASNQDTNQTVAIGAYANAWGDQSTAIGNNVDAKGNSSIAIGADDWDTVAVKTVEGTGKTVKEVYQDYTGDVMETGSYTHTTSSEAAVAIGTKSQATGELSTAFGTGTRAEGVASAAFGMGAKATQGNSVAIGAGSSTTTGATSVNEATVNNLKYSGFAGGNSVNPGDQVSFGSKNYERQLKNVAPGEISNTSTDAINGSQLYAVQNVLGNTAKTVKDVLGGNAKLAEDGSITMSNIGNTGAGNIHDAINSVKETAEKGWKLKANDEADSESEKIAAGDTVTVKQGKNIRVKRSSKELTIETADDVAFNKVTVGNSVLTTDGLNTPQVTAGDSVLGNNGLTIANGANPVSLTKSGLDNGGNKVTNIADGVADTDAASYKQVKAAKTEVQKGTNVVSVDKTEGTDGHAIYTVNAKGTAVSAEGTDNGLKLTSSEDSTTNVTTYNLDLSDKTKDSLKKADSALQGIDVKVNDENVKTLTKDDSTLKFVNGTGTTAENKGGTVTFNVNKSTLTTGAGGVVSADTAGDAFATAADVAKAINKAVVDSEKTSVVAAGDNTHVAAVEAGNQTTYTVHADNTTVSVKDGGKLALKSSEATNSNHTKTTNYELDLSDDTKAEIQKGVDAKNIVDTKGITFNGDSGSPVTKKLDETLAIKGDDKNVVTESGADGIKVKLKDEITVQTVNADKLKAGDSVLTNDGLNIANGNNPVSLTKSGLNNGGNKITKVAKGENEDDAVNYAQLKELAEKGLTFDADGNTSTSSKKLGERVGIKGGNNITTSADSDNVTVKLNDDITLNSVTATTLKAGASELTTTGLTTPKVTAGDSVLTTDGLNIANGAAGSPVSLTKDGLNNGGNKVTNVAKGTADTDAVNFSQLNPIAKALNTTVNPDGSIAAPNFTVKHADGTEGTPVHTVQDALDKVGEEVTKGINVGGTTGSNKYALGGTINIKGDSNIVSDTVEGGVQLKLADTVKIGQDSGKPVSIDGTAGTVSGLSNTTLGNTPLAGSNKAATEAQLDATQVNLKNILGGEAKNENGNVSTEDIGGTGENTIHDAIKSVKATADKGWKLKANDEADSESEKIAAGDTVTVKQGKNIRVKRSGKDLTIETADDVAFNKVTVGNSVLTTDGLTTPQVTAGDSVLGNNGLTIANGTAGSPVSLTKDGLNNGGNKVTNVAKGTADTDAVNFSQLNPIAKALNTTVNPDGSIAAPNFTVKHADGTEGTPVHTVQDALDKVGEEVTKGINVGGTTGSNKYALGGTINIKGDSNIVSDTVEGGVQLKLADTVKIGQDSGKPVSIDGTAGTVSGLSNTTLGNTPLAGSNKAATEAQLDATQVNLKNILGGEAKNENGNVSTEDIGGTGENTIHDAIKSVKATADKGWKLKANDEADSESEKIAAGDTVTVKQGKNIRVKRSGKDLTIETEDDVAFNKVTVGNSELTTTGLTTPKVTAGDSVLTTDGLNIANGAAGSPVSLTKDGLNNGGNKVTNVAKGTADTDGVNVSQLNPVAKALNTNIDPTTGEVAAPSFTVTKADGTKHPAVGTVQDALDKVGEEVTKGLNIVADNGSSEKVNLGDTVKYTSKDKNIVTTSGTGKAIDFSLAEKVTIGKDAANGGKPVVIDGKEGIVSGLTNTTLGAAPLADSNKAATEAQLDATQVNFANVLGGNAANNNGNVTTSDIGGTGESNVHDAIKSVKATADKGWNLNANDETSSEKIGAGDTVSFKEGKNVKVSRNGKSITIATSDDVSFKTVTVGDSVLTDNGLTVGNGKAGKPVSLTKDGLNNGGNKIANVAAGEADTDAVNVAQLKAAAAKATSKVESGNDNIVVAPEQNADGSTTYKVATAPNLKADSFTAGDTVVNKDGVKVGDKVALGRDGLKAGDVNITADGINAGNKAISNVAEGKKDTDAVNVAQLKAAAAKATSKVESGNDNIVVTPEQNADGSTTYKVATAPDLKADSLTTGDTVVNNDGVKVGDKVALTKDGLDNGGNKVANVAAGEADTDAVNVAQLKAAAAKATSKVESGNDNIVVTPEQNADGSTTYKVATAPDLKADSLTTGDTVVNNDGVKVGDKVALGKDGLKAGDVNITADGINAGNKAISNVAEGKKDTDAVNVGQLNRLTAAAKTEVEAGTNIASVSSKQGANKQTVYTINADGASVSAGSDKIVVTKGKKDANNVTDYAVDLSKAVKDDIAKGVAAKDAVDNKGISFAGDSGTTVANKLGDTVAVKGDANITTTAGANGIQVGLNKDLKVDSVTTGGVTVNAQGISIGAPTAYNPANTVSLSPNGLNNGGQRITNVAPAKEGTDAVNLNQLVGMGNALQNNIANVGKKAYAGVAGAIAQGSIPQVTRPGATGIGVGSGYYGGQSAMAIGVSAMSDGGNWIVKGNFSANTDGHVGVGAGALYQW